jgi:hypothetical protein
MTNMEFAMIVAQSAAGSVAAIEPLMKLSMGSGFVARKARMEPRKIGVEVVS